MEIEFELDRDEPLDAVDVLGDIRLTSDGRSIIQKCTFIDSWLFTLVEGLEKLEALHDFSLDLVDEPVPLEFRFHPSGISIRYKDCEITIENAHELRDALADAAKDLIDSYSMDGQIEKNPMLVRLASFSQALPVAN